MRVFIKLTLLITARRHIHIGHDSENKPRSHKTFETHTKKSNLNDIQPRLLPNQYIEYSLPLLHY